jgi:hypothetical protein
MDYRLFQQHRSTLLNLPPASGFDDRLLMEREGRLSIYYAPFDYVNPEAKVVVVGITPGRTQMANALAEAQRQLRQGQEDAVAVRAAKQTAAFSGSIRPNLVALLDHVGIHAWLGIATTASLFDTDAHLFQPASVLCYPVFVDGKDYRGTPNLLRTPLLQRYLLAHFAEQARRLPDAIFVPVGDTPAEALGFLASKGVIDPERILDGLPHPSGANGERVAYFLERKSREALSAKTDPGKLDRARSRLIDQVDRLKKLS